MKASDLRGVLTYIPSFRDKLFVLSVDSAVLEDERAASLFLDISVLRSLNIRVALVHGASARVNLLVTAGGAVTDSGNLVIGGTTTVTATGFNVTLDQAGNDFTGPVGVTGANVTLVDANGINLGASTVTGNYSVTATAGDITNSGALVVTGNSTFTADAAGANIILGNAGNNFAGTVTFAGAGGLNDVTITDLSALDLGGLTLTGNLLVTAGGAVTDSGNLVIGGTTTVTATGSNLFIAACEFL